MGNANLDELWAAMEEVMPIGAALFIDREGPTTFSWSVYSDAGNGKLIATSDRVIRSLNMVLLDIIEALTKVKNEIK